MHHDALRQDAPGLIAALLTTLDATGDVAALSAQIAPPGHERADRARYAPELLARADALYERLMASPRTLQPLVAPAAGTGAS